LYTALPLVSLSYLGEISVQEHFNETSHLASKIWTELVNFQMYQVLTTPWASKIWTGLVDFQMYPVLTTPWASKIWTGLVDFQMY